MTLLGTPLDPIIEPTVSAMLVNCDSSVTERTTGGGLSYHVTIAFVLLTEEPQSGGEVAFSLHSRRIPIMRLLCLFLVVCHFARAGCLCLRRQAPGNQNESGSSC